MPKVSVIIPAYNHEKFVRTAIQSVFDQTIQDFEIIIRDDKSKDNTLNEVKKFTDHRIKLISSGDNMGQFASTNICIKKARGDYLCFLNSDDSFNREKLKKQIAYLESNKHIAAVFTRPELIDENNEVIRNGNNFFNKLFGQPFLSGYPLLRHFFFGGNFLCHPSVMIRKKALLKIGMYNEFFAQLSDLDYWVRLSFKYQVGMVEEKLTQFRIHTDGSNMSGDKPSTLIRSSIEWKYILNYYLNIKTIEELTAIFPEIKHTYNNLNKQYIPFYISMLCFDSPYQLHHQFGLDTLYKVLQNPILANAVTKYYGFTKKDFIKLTGKFDLYQNKVLSDLQQQLDNKLLASIQKSKFYKIWRLFRTK